MSSVMAVPQATAGVPNVGGRVGLLVVSSAFIFAKTCWPGWSPNHGETGLNPRGAATRRTVLALVGEVDTGEDGPRYLGKHLLVY